VPIVTGSKFEILFDRAPLNVRAERECPAVRRA
jgi:hypothetical protein